TRRRSIIRSITHAPGQTVARPQLRPWLISTSPLPAPPFCRIYDFYVLSRPFSPSWNQLRKSSRTPSQFSFRPTNHRAASVCECFERRHHRPADGGKRLAVPNLKAANNV